MKFLVALLCALVLSFQVSCSAIQPTHNPDGSQTASPAGKEVLHAADAGQAVIQSAASLPGLPGLIFAGVSLLTAYGVKRLHDKLDDITPETPVISTVPAK